MGRLQKRLNQKHKLEKIEKKEKTKKDKSSRRKGNSIIPVYNTKGKTITPEKKRRDRILAGITIAICAIVVFLYVPQYLPMFQEKERGVRLTLRLRQAKSPSGRICSARDCAGSPLSFSGQQSISGYLLLSKISENTDNFRQYLACNF